MHSGRSLTGVVLVSAMWLSCASMAAQSTLPAERRTDDEFGSPDHDSRQRLDLTVSAVGAYDDDLLNDLVLPTLGAGSNVLVAPQRGGTYESLSAQLAYTRKFRESTFAASGRSMAQHLQGLGQDITYQHEAALGFDFHRRGTQIALQQSYTAFSLYAIQTAPSLFQADIAALPLLATDEAIAASPGWRSVSSLEFNQTLSRRVMLSASSTLWYTSIDNTAAKLRQDLASAHITYQFKRDLGLVTGYQVQRGDYQSVFGVQRVDVQNIDLGLRYNHALSFSRRTTVGFSSGPVLVQDPQTGTTQYTVGGEARLNHQLGRTWQATAAVSRGVTFVDGFQSPFLGDTVAVNLGGLLRRRVEFSIGGSAWRGRILQSTDPSADRNETATGTSRLRMVLTPSIALTAEYRYFHYRFSVMPLLIAGIQPRTDLNSVRVGVDFGLPIFR